MTRLVHEGAPERRTAAWRAALIAALAATVLSGCSIGGPGVDPANDPAPESVVDEGSVVDDGEDFDLAAFCAEAIPMTTPVEREYVGSDEHVQDFRDLRAVAPEDLDPTIALLIDHYELDVSPSDPESQNFDNFPTDVQEAGQLLVREINARC